MTLLNEYADQFQKLLAERDEQVQQARADLEEERNLLATIMANLRDGVVVCNREGRILLYNVRARTLLSGSHSSISVIRNSQFTIHNSQFTIPKQLSARRMYVTKLGEAQFPLAQLVYCTPIRYNPLRHPSFLRAAWERTIRRSAAHQLDIQSRIDYQQTATQQGLPLTDLGPSDYTTADC